MFSLRYLQRQLYFSFKVLKKAVSLFLSNLKVFFVSTYLKDVFPPFDFR